MHKLPEQRQIPLKRLVIVPHCSRDSRRRQTCDRKVVEENNMNWDQIEGRWRQFTGSARERWGKITDNDWEAVSGKKDQLVGRIQVRMEWRKKRPKSRRMNGRSLSPIPGLHAAAPRRAFELARLSEGRKVDETKPRANCGPLVQDHALGANVAGPWPVRMPHVRTPPTGLLGTAAPCHAAAGA